MKEQMGMMGGMNPMELMQKMSGMGMKMMEQMGEGFNPMEMCRKMTESVTKAAEMGSYATPEVRALFEDWVGEVEKEILTFVEAKGEVEPKDIAEKLKINEGSVIFFISRLAQQGKVKLRVLA
ncbi:MAG: winged helix-turn-helix domain-containing protein [Desulfotomaculales bacterium]